MAKSGRRSETPVLLSEQSELESLCRAWRDRGAFAFDTEFIRDDTFDAYLCLIQVADGETVTLIDPTGLSDLDCFWQLVVDPDVLTIVHAGKEDFDLALRATGQPPRNVFDVQVAAGFVGCGYPLSLARLVQAALGRRIAKNATLTDWSRRPLTREQLRYAVDDVAFLPAIHARIAGQLDARGRSAWAAEEFAAFENPRLYDPPIEDRLFRIKGSRKLDRLGLAVLQRLIRWREDWAREANRPVRALMRDDILVEVARRRPTEPGELKVLRGFPQARNPRIIQQLIGEIDAAARTPKEEWPAAFEHREEDPRVRAITDFMLSFVRIACIEAELDPDLFGTRQRVVDLLDHLSAGQRGDGTPPALLHGWRAEFLGRRMVELLDGAGAMRITGWPDAPGIDVAWNGQATPRGASHESRP